MMISRSNVNFLLVCCSMSSSSDSLDVSKFAEWEYPWEDISATNLWKRKTQSPDNHQKNTMTIIHCEKHPTLNFAYENPWMSLPFICLWKNVEQKSPNMVCRNHGDLPSKITLNSRYGPPMEALERWGPQGTSRNARCPPAECPTKAMGTPFRGTKNGWIDGFSVRKWCNLC